MYHAFSSMPLGRNIAWVLLINGNAKSTILLWSLLFITSLSFMKDKVSIINYEGIFSSFYIELFIIGLVKRYQKGVASCTREVWPEDKTGRFVLLPCVRNIREAYFKYGFAKIIFTFFGLPEMCLNSYLPEYVHKFIIFELNYIIDDLFLCNNYTLIPCNYYLNFVIMSFIL